jgi:hypothetical protein
VRHFGLYEEQNPSQTLDHGASLLVSRVVLGRSLVDILEAFSLMTRSEVFMHCNRTQ